MASLRLALFDCDGTLVDSQHLIVRSALAACAALNLPSPEPAAVRHLVGLSLDEAMRTLAPDLADDLLAEMAAAYRREYTRLMTTGSVKAPLFPGVSAALERLEAAEMLLGIATGKSRRGLDETLAVHGIARRFTTLQTADRARSKPAPDMVLKAAAETGVAVTDVVVIGDTVYDIAMALAAGARAIGVSWGYHPAMDLAEAGAHAIADSFDALPAIIEGMWAA